MPFFCKIFRLPGGLKRRLWVSFCLMSVLPILLMIYGRDNPWILLFAVVMAALGIAMITRLLKPIPGMAKAAQEVARRSLGTAELLAAPEDEIEGLSRALSTISRNAADLLERVEKLSLKDKLTGLYNSAYILERLREEIHRAVHHQRSCAFAYIWVSDLEQVAHRTGQAGADALVCKIAQVIQVPLAEFDRAARMRDGEFAVIFPERSKKTAIESAGRIRSAILELLSGQGQAAETLKVSVGISENPIDGTVAEEIFDEAVRRCKIARVRGVGVEAFAE